MAVTNNVLNAINVFSSTSVFDSNKGSVGANDLNFIKQTTAELATEGGGIIAQSLGTNGYVKFANGLILQWGVTNRENCGSCFPLTYSVPYAVIAEEHHLTETATGYDGSFMTTRLTTRGFSYRTESTGYSNAIMFVVFGV